MRTGTLASWFAPLFLAPPLVAAQEHVVRGQIIDRATRNGVAGAWAEVPALNHRFGADNLGTFTVRLPSGSHDVLVHAFGYRTAVYRLDLRADTLVAWELQAEPIELAAIQVQIDRLERRTRALPLSVRTVDRAELVSSPAADPVEVLKSRFLQLFPCRDRAECVRRRGALVEPLVCVDELRAFGGLGELRSYPAGSLYRVELIDGGTQIRAYTTLFIERVQAGQIALRATISGC
jgi:hypothetical protein